MYLYMHYQKVTLQHFNSSNVMADLPVENDGASIVSTGDTGNQPECLNSSNDGNIVKSLLRLRTLCYSVSATELQAK